MPAELIETAARIFRDESRDGFRDRMVIGGLAGFTERLRNAGLGAHVERAADLLRDYAALPPDQRAARLAEAQQLLTGSRDGGVAVAPAHASSVRVPPAHTAQAPKAQSAAKPPPPGLTLETPLETLTGIGPVRARLYRRLGLTTIGDLLFHFPLRHQQFPPPVPIAELVFQPSGSIVGTLQRLDVENLPRGLRKLRATIKDPTGTASAVWLRHGVARIGVPPGELIAVSGQLVQQGRQLVFDNPDYERGDSVPIHTRRMVPVHPLTAGLTERELRSRVHWALTFFASRVPEPLPSDVLADFELRPVERALWDMHFPESADAYDAARRRFAFEELLTIQLLVLRRRMQWQQEGAPALEQGAPARTAFERALPFQLTAAQRRVTDEILHDMASRRPMTRLLQGEVGSGKTAVAALALLTAVANGYQGAFMAPTEILAEQHFATLSRLFEAAAEPLAASLGRMPTIDLLTGSLKSSQRTRTYAAVADGAADIVVGTQALIQDKLEFSQLGLVVVDEQHRFGVRQRVTLRHKADATDSVPHLLVMTATPIPRTLALSLYGDLDLSAIDEMPPGRTPPKTVLLAPDERHLGYERIRRAAAHGEQAFIICPLVAESETLDAKAATEEYERLRDGELSTLRLGLLHGRMKSADKDAVMRAFRAREFDVLVSTAVVEVGVDIPNATVMLIEGAERFGLAQLHQFRGRIGRGGQPSVCILLPELPDPEANARLRVLASTTDGLRLAEHDLRLRGPGDFFGVRQSGLPELRVARLDDAVLVEAARASAGAILDRDPDLLRPEHAALRTHLLDFAARAGEPS